MSGWPSCSPGLHAQTAQRVPWRTAATPAGARPKQPPRCGNRTAGFHSQSSRRERGPGSPWSESESRCKAQQGSERSQRSTAAQPVHLDAWAVGTGGRSGAGAEELPGRRVGVLTHTLKAPPAPGRVVVGADTPTCTRHSSRAEVQGPGTRDRCCGDRARTSVGGKAGSRRTPSDTTARGGRPRPAAESVHREPACLRTS